MPKFGRLGLVYWSAAIILAIMPGDGRGQNVYGTISGTVTDVSGAVIAGTDVTLTNLATGEKRDIATDSSGNYTFVNILPGRY